MFDNNIFYLDLNGEVKLMFIESKKKTRGRKMKRKQTTAIECFFTYQSQRYEQQSNAGKFEVRVRFKLIHAALFSLKIICLLDHCRH